MAANDINRFSNQQNAASNIPAPAPVLEQHISALSGLHDQLSGAVNRLHALNERLFGPEPQGIGSQSAAKAPTPVATVARLDTAVSEARDYAQAIHALLDRLERI